MRNLSREVLKQAIINVHKEVAEEYDFCYFCSHHPGMGDGCHPNCVARLLIEEDMKTTTILEIKDDFPYVKWDGKLVKCDFIPSLYTPKVGDEVEVRDVSSTCDPNHYLLRPKK